MIPVLIVPVVSRFDLLERMLASLDEPIGRLVIVDNSLTGYIAPARGVLQTVERVDHLRPILGLGYPGGINAGISQTPGAAWWMWASVDLSFGPGDLHRIDALMNDTDGPRHVTGSHRGLRNVYGAMNRRAVETVGLFDEWAFYPIYFDDDDMERRCRLGDVEWLTYDGTIRHAGSQTIAEPRFAAANSRTYQMNAQAYVDKWGGLPGQERYLRPYGLDVPLSFVRPDPLNRAMRTW